MFELSGDHMTAFRGVAQDHFEQRAVLHLRQQFGAETFALTDGELRERVRTGRERARGWGLLTEVQIMDFVDTGFLIGEDFDSDPGESWTRDLLGDKELPADQRSAVLVSSARILVATRGGGNRG